MERKEIEEALRESERRYREIVEKAGIAILIDDEKGNIKYANKKAAELYGYSQEEMNDQLRQLVAGQRQRLIDGEDIIDVQTIGLDFSDVGRDNE